MRLKLIVWLHHLVIASAVFSVIGSFITASLPVAIAVFLFVGHLATTSSECILTRIENKLRKKHELPQIKGFVKHYYLRGK